MPPSWSPSCSLSSRVLSYCAVHHNSLYLGSSFFLPWLKKSPSRPHFSAGCVSSFPSSPSCHHYSIFSPWPSHPTAQFSKVRLLSRLKVSLSTPPSKAPCCCRIFPVLRLATSSPWHVPHLQLNHTGFSPSPRSFPARLPASPLAAPAGTHR